MNTIENKSLMSVINKIEQFLHETYTWERLIYFFRQENIFLKTRLSEVVDPSTDKGFLALAEQFQNQFILKDEFMDELTHDVKEQQTKLNELAEKNLVIEDKLSKKQRKLRNETQYLEKDFNRLKYEFNIYLTNIS
jgi:replicative DNA helicase